MPKSHRPRHGSLGYSPRKRAKKQVTRIRSWPEAGKSPKIQGFAGFKAGMTHVVMVDDRPNSLTEGAEISVPVTVIEVPPMNVVGIRIYSDDVYGKKISHEVWGGKSNSDKLLKNIEKKIAEDMICDLRVLVSTSPESVSGIPKKKSDLMEYRVSGGSFSEKFEYAKALLGNKVNISDIFEDGEFIDVSAITKGKGTQGPVKRWGVKIQRAKAYRSSKGRHVGTLGPWKPHRVRWTVPQLGQMGYHQRTEYNKRILKIGKSGDEITPKGGFINYGIVRNEYVLIKGSVPGPIKRLIRFRKATRQKRGLKELPNIVYISRESKQGA